MRSSLGPLSVVAEVSVAGLLLLLAAAVCSAQSAPFYLTSIGSVNGTLVEGVLVPGASQPVFVRNEAFSVTPASNNAAPSSAAVSRLQSINHFIIVVLNQESFDAVMGAYPKGNTLNNSAAPPSPAVALQVQRPQFTGTAATPGLTSGAPYSSLPVDTDGSAQINVSLPNAPYLYNSFFPPTVKVQQDPPHGYQQAIYKIDGGRMDGFQWTSDTSGELAMGHWLLTGSNLYALAANFTLFDRFFGSAFGGPLLGHFYIIGGRSTQWDNGNSQPPLVLQDNATLSYHNYSTADGLMTDVTQEGIMSWPDNFLLNNIHSPAFCGPPFWPIINDASTTGVPAHLGDQLTAVNVSWGYYAQDWNSEVIEALTGDNCHAWNNDSKMSSNMLPFTHYARFNPPRTAPASLQHLQDLDNGTTANFFSKLAAGQLESVAWVQPDKRFDWGGGDVAPAPADAWLGSTMQAIYASPHWQAQDTMVIVTWENANGRWREHSALHGLLHCLSCAAALSLCAVLQASTTTSRPTLETGLALGCALPPSSPRPIMRAAWSTRTRTSICPSSR